MLIKGKSTVEYKDLISYDTMTGLLSFDREKHYFSLSVVNSVFIFDGHVYVSVRIPKCFRVFKCKLPKGITYEELITLDDVICDINDYIKNDDLHTFNMRCVDVFQEFNLCGYKLDYVEIVMLLLVLTVLVIHTILVLRC